MMPAFASANEVVWAGVVWTVMMCQPNCVFTGWEISPSFRAKATFSNSGTNWPLTSAPSSPPLSLVVVSVEFSRASWAKFSGVTSERILSASAFVGTRMWLTWRPAATLNWAMFAS